MPALPDGGPSPTGVDHAQFAAVLARFSGTLTGKYTLDEVLAQLGDDVTTVLGVAGAGVMLADDDGSLHFVTTTNGSLAALERLQLQLNEGPCLLAYRTGEIVEAPDLAGDTRFPTFGQQAVTHGLGSVNSFPMSVDGITVGALNLYAPTSARGLDAAQIQAGAVFAHVATAYVMHARDLDQREISTQELQRALSSRHVVEQAKGFVSGIQGVSLPAAFELIRGYARDHRIKVQVVARGVIEGDIDVSELSDGQAGRPE